MGDLFAGRAFLIAIGNFIRVQRKENKRKFQTVGRGDKEMVKTIWKFELKLVDTQRIEMPQGAQILTVQLQTGRPCMWATVDPTEAALTEMRVFAIRGTGNPLDDEAGMADIYLATFQQPPFVWHVFERVKEDEARPN